MRLTARDVRLTRDIALSHVLTRDQILELDYFGTVTRVNTRTRELVRLGLLRKLATPFFAQTIYMAGTAAVEIAGERIAPLLAARTGSPRFLQHAMTVTNVRIALMKRGAKRWHFEQQLRTTVAAQGASYEVRPDGLAEMPSGVTFVEVDMGHVDAAKFRQKLLGYQAYASSGAFTKIWNLPRFKLLVLTTSEHRASQLMRLAPASPTFDYLCVPFGDLGVAPIGAWS